MESWQRDHIEKNLPELIRTTNFNVILKAILRSKGILSQEETLDLVSLYTKSSFSVTVYVIHEHGMSYKI